MNCLYITLFFNIVAGIVQTFIKSWNQLLYPQVIEVCHQPFEPCNDFLHLIIVVKGVSLGEETSGNHNVTVSTSSLFVNFCWTFTFCIEKSYVGTHLTFGGIWDWHCHFKHVSFKQSQFYHCQMSTAHR